ncbi:MAG: C4-dicarboxylate-specific signal transduction histidine kinase [Hyphomicrobiaceae bacterium]|jgi:C4-dicarboxylate-specific signal transduction histidine kinase
MAEEKKSAEAQLSDAVWQWAARAVLTAVLLGVGYFAGYVQMGDAPGLRQENKELEDRIVDLQNQRETASTRTARETRDKEVCEKQLKSVKADLAKATAAAKAAAAAQ